MMSYRAPSGRRLRAEQLEDRRMMATLTVTTAFDVVNAGDGVTSLREAINSANALPGEDLIDFDPALFGATIQLQAANPLTISDDLMLSGLGAEELTVRGA